MIKVSVIIPIFNAEKYLYECLNSLMNQTLNEIEFICINDGSTDRSLKILEAFKVKDKRIIIINQNNQGVSVARNTGFQIAKGDYIGFVDADDVVEKEMYQILYEATKKSKAAIVVSNFITEQQGLKQFSKPLFPVDIVFNQKYIHKKIIPFFLREDGLNSCCTKIYCKKLISNQNIGFQKGLKNGEDAMFNLQIFNKANSVEFLNYAGYYYREVENSATRDIVSKDYFEIAHKVYKLKYNFELQLTEEEIKKLKAIRLINTVVSIMHMYFKPKNDLSFLKRYTYVRRMMYNKTVQKVIKEHLQEIKKDKNKYQIFILNSLKYKFMLGIFLAISYSNYRNR